jgi:two-component sensor histidine kinase
MSDNPAIHESWEIAAQVKLLKCEVNHRAKNLLSVVLAMARLTDKGKNPEDFAAKLCERIAGLAASHDLLAGSEWQGVDTAELVGRQMAHFHQRIGSRVLLKGPPVKLRPFAAQSVGVALHELVLNAGEYGALSGDYGVVRVAWNVVNNGSEPLFTMRWSESGGPPVKIPACRGFGHRVLCEITRYGLDANTRLDYRPGGVVWRLTASAERILA